MDFCLILINIIKVLDLRYGFEMLNYTNKHARDKSTSIYRGINGQTDGQPYG